MTAILASALSITGRALAVLVSGPLLVLALLGPALRGALTGLSLGLLAALLWVGVSLGPPGTIPVLRVTLLGGLLGAIWRGAAAFRRLRASPPDVHGSARWATSKEAATFALPRGAEAHGLPHSLLVGREMGGRQRLLAYDGPAHLLTVAPTRSGKGVGTLLPNLLLARRSLLCVDPKGENARISARARRRFGPVHVLDPFGASGQPASRYDPLAVLDPDSPDLAEDVATLADALVHDPAGQVSEAHWNEEAKALIGGILLHVATSEPPDRRRLATLRTQLTLPPARFQALLGEMGRSDAARGLVARAANRQMGKSHREATGVLSSAQRHTHFSTAPASPTPWTAPTSASRISARAS